MYFVYLYVCAVVVCCIWGVSTVVVFYYQGVSLLWSMCELLCFVPRRVPLIYGCNDVVRCMRGVHVFYIRDILSFCIQSVTVLFFNQKHNCPQLQDYLNTHIWIGLKFETYDLQTSIRPRTGQVLCIFEWLNAQVDWHWQ